MSSTTKSCEKCDSNVPDKYLSGTPPDELWVECTCGAHSGWYCPDHSPGNDCWCDEKCDCCNPEEEEEGKKWCNVGEHHVDVEDMWSNFADCKNCVSEKEYLAATADDEEEE